MRAFITGGAGFIGSNLVDRLLSRGDSVTVYDNLSTGQPRFLEGARAQKQAPFQFVQADILDGVRLTEAMAGHDFVFHLAANADVRFGTQHPRKDLDPNTLGTWQVLEAMRANGMGRIAFSSTGSVYGEAKLVPTPEDAPFPVQTSLYGASKLLQRRLRTEPVSGAIVSQSAGRIGRAVRRDREPMSSRMQVAIALAGKLRGHAPSPMQRVS